MLRILGVFLYLKFEKLEIKKAARLLPRGVSFGEG